MLVYLLQQQAPLCASYIAKARATATEITHAFVLLKATLPDRTPHELVLKIVSLAFTNVQK